MKHMNHGLSAIGALAFLAACSAAPVSESNAAVTTGTGDRDGAAAAEAPALKEQAPAAKAAAKAVVTIPTDDPLKLVQALYAGYPWERYPPGGFKIWYWGLPMDSAARPEENRGIPILRESDFMVAGAKGPITNLRIENGDATDAERQIIVTFDSGTQKDITVYYGTLLTDDGWQISNVWRDDGWNLSDAIQAELIHD